MASVQPNYTVFAIPAYYILCLIPHGYSAGLLRASSDAAKKSPNSKIKEGKIMYNFFNPRSTENAERYASVLDKATYYKWERARAVHGNLLESAPFVLAAFVIGIVTKLPSDFMNNIVLAYFGTRILYAISYIAVAKGPLALGRTVWWFAGNFLLLAVFIKAGTKVLNGEI